MRITGSPLLFAVVLAAIAGGCALTTTAPRTQAVTLYVQNEGSGLAWFAAEPQTDPPFGQGYPEGVGVGCQVLPMGAEIVRLSGRPQDPSVTVTQVIDRLIGPPGQPRILWVHIAGDGTATTGLGVPAWWVDPPMTC
jgi:hypothetical protein